MDDQLVADAAAISLPLLQLLRGFADGMAADNPQALAQVFILLMQMSNLNSQRVYIGLMAEAGMFELLQNPEFSEVIRGRMEFRGRRLLWQAERSANGSAAAFLRSLVGMHEAEIIKLTEGETMAALCGALGRLSAQGDAAAHASLARELLLRLVPTLDTFKQLGQLLNAYLNCPDNTLPAAAQNEVVRSLLRNPDVADLGGESRDLLAALPPELAVQARTWLAEGVEDDSSADEDGNLRDFVCDDEEVDYEDSFTSDLLDTTGTFGTTQESLPRAARKRARATGTGVAAGGTGATKAAGRGSASRKSGPVPVRGGRLRRDAGAAARATISSSEEDSSDSESSALSSSSSSAGSSDSSSSDSSSDSEDSWVGRKRGKASGGRRIAAKGSNNKGKEVGSKKAVGKPVKKLVSKQASHWSSDDEDVDELDLSSSSGADTASLPSSDSEGRRQPPRKRARLSTSPGVPSKRPVPLNTSVIELGSDDSDSEGGIVVGRSSAHTAARRR